MTSVMHKILCILCILTAFPANGEDRDHGSHSDLAVAGQLGLASISSRDQNEQRVVGVLNLHEKDMSHVGHDNLSGSENSEEEKHLIARVEFPSLDRELLSAFP